MSPTLPRPAEAGPRQRRKQARPHELLEAALTLFVEKDRGVGARFQSLPLHGVEVPSS